MTDEKVLELWRQLDKAKVKTVFQIKQLQRGICETREALIELVTIMTPTWCSENMKEISVQNFSDFKNGKYNNWSDKKVLSVYIELRKKLPFA